MEYFATNNPMTQSERSGAAKNPRDIRRTLSGKGGDPLISNPTFVGRSSGTGNMGLGVIQPKVDGGSHAGGTIKFDQKTADAAVPSGAMNVTTADFLQLTRSRIMSINSRR